MAYSISARLAGCGRGLAETAATGLLDVLAVKPWSPLRRSDVGGSNNLFLNSLYSSHTASQKSLRSVCVNRTPI